MAGSINLKRMNWFRSQTGWEQMQEWKSKRQDMSLGFQNEAAAASSAFATAFSNQIIGSANLAAQAAVDRLKSTVNKTV